MDLISKQKKYLSENLIVESLRMYDSLSEKWNRNRIRIFEKKRPILGGMSLNINIPTEKTLIKMMAYHLN